MATFLLIPGAGDVPWSWHLVVRALEERGHDAVAVDLPSEDDSAGFSEYADAALATLGDRTNPVVVGHSLGGYTATLVCDRVPARLLVFVAGMVPRPGEPAGEFWANTGHSFGSDDPVETFMHDVPPDLVAGVLSRERDQSGTPMGEPWPLEAWPSVPTRYLLCRDDRFFPAEWTRARVCERLGIEPDEMDGSHAPFLSRPEELAERLVDYCRARG